MKIQISESTLDLSVVIPTLNEGPNLKKLLPNLIEALESMNVTWEVLVIDGMSQDGTPEIVNEFEAIYVGEEKKGYAAAILRGISDAAGRYVLTMDADLSHPTQVVESLWAKRKDAEINIASRYVAGGKADQPWTRLQLSKILNAFFRIGLDIKVLDMSSGFRLYNKHMFSKLDLEFTDNFVILVEILLKAHAQGLLINEVPFHYQNREEGISKARVFSFGMDYLRLFRKVWKVRNSVNFPDYDWRAHNSRIPLQRYWQRKRYNIIMRFTDKEGSICDIGCGSSHILADLPNAVGVDLRHDKLAYMRRTNKFLVRGDGMKLPFDDEQFDCVISSEVIEHIPEENGVHVDEIVRILKPGGILVLGTPDYDRWEWVWIEWLYGKVKPDAYADEHVTHYTYKTLSGAMIERGVEVLDHDYICRGELIFQGRKKA